MSKYVSFNNLSHYDEKIKEYIEEHSGGSSDYEIGNLKAFDYHTAKTALVLESLKPGVYILYTNGSFDIHFKALESSSGTQYIHVNGSDEKLILLLTQTPTSALDNWSILGTIITNSIGFSNSEVYTTNYMLYYKTSDNGNMSFETVQSNTSATIADIDTAQTISGKKTFSTLPESSVVPTTDDQLTNKKYVDDTVSNIGDVNQYFITGNSSSNPFIFKGKKKGVYHFIDKKPSDNIYYKFDTSDSNTSDPLVPLEINILKDINGTEANGTLLGYTTKAGMSSLPFSSVYCIEIKRGTSSSTGLSTGIPSNGSIQYVTIERPQTISSEKTFSTLPKSTVVPTNDAHLVNKKYVDDNSVKLITTNTNIWELAHGVYKVEAGVQLNYKPTSSGYITVGNYGTFLFVSKASNGSVPFYLLGRSVTNNTKNEMYIGVAQNNTYGICDVYNLGNIELAVTTTDNQTIYGVKNFYVLPESSVVPTTNNQLVNKKYVDDTVIQKSTMPTASSTNLGTIIQYIGTTDSTYTNGYFYKCVSDGEETPTYSWQNISVQSGGSGQSAITYLGKATDYDSSAERLDISTLKQNTLYAIWNNNSRSSTDKSLYVKVPINGTTYNYDLIINKNGLGDTASLADGMFIYLVVTADLSTTISTGDSIFSVFEQFDTVNSNRNIFFNGSVLSSSSVSYPRGIVNDSLAQTISGVKTFNSFPLVSGTPTLNNELINKGFADATYASQSDLSSLITYGTTDLSPGDTLPDGTLYIVYDNN